MKRLLPLQSKLALLLAVATALLAVGACGGDDDAQPAATAAATTTTTVAQPAFPVTLRDGGGSDVTIPAAPKRIVSYSPAATEVLFAIGADKEVVGADRFSNYPPEVKAIATLEYSKPSAEPVLALKADLVIMAGQQSAQVPQFRQVGLRVLHLVEPNDLPGVLAQIELLGKATGHMTEASTLTSAMRRRIDAVTGRLASVSAGPKVFYELSPDGYTVGPNSFLGGLLKLVKAGNVAEGTTNAFPQINLEAIVAANPEVIILADTGEYGGQGPETVRSRPGWANLKAVRDGRIYGVDADLFSRPGPRIVDALDELARLLYPDRR